MKKITSKSKRQYSAILACAALTLAFGFGQLHAQTFTYSDSGVANATTGANYYTAADGNTATGGTTGAFTVTENDAGLLSGASLKVASGSLTIHSGDYGLFDSETGPASTDVSGGSLTLSTIGDVNQFGSTAAIFFGSGGAFTFTQEGGTTTIAAQSGFYLGNGSSGSATVTLTGGVLDDTDTVGTIFSNGVLSLGSGTFEQTGTNTLSFTTGDINFLTGSTGSVSLLGETLAQYTTLINNGDILIGGTAATASSFTYTTVGTQGVLSLAAVPEPSTWAMMVGGLAVLLGIQRKRFLRA